MPPNRKAHSKTRAPRRLHAGLTPEERNARRRRRILDAGLEIFGTHGYAGSRINDLCKMAHVTARNFYDHFASREELLIAIYDEIIADVYAAAVDAMNRSADDSLDLIRDGITAFVKTMAADERRLRINFVEVVGATSEVEARRRRAIEMFRELLASQVRALEERGVVPRGSNRLTFSALVGAMQESLVDWVDRDDRPPLDEVIDELVRIFELTLRLPPPTHS